MAFLRRKTPQNSALRRAIRARLDNTLSPADCKISPRVVQQVRVLSTPRKREDVDENLPLLVRVDLNLLQRVRLRAQLVLARRKFILVQNIRQDVCNLLPVQAAWLV